MFLNIISKKHRKLQRLQWGRSPPAVCPAFGGRGRERISGDAVCDVAKHSFSYLLKSEKKSRFDTFFGRFFAFRKSQNAVNYNIFAF